jgi:hypothetical protein
MSKHGKGREWFHEFRDECLNDCARFEKPREKRRKVKDFGDGATYVSK